MDMFHSAARFLKTCTVPVSTILQKSVIFLKITQNHRKCILVSENVKSGALKGSAFDAQTPGNHFSPESVPVYGVCMIPV